MPNGPLISHAFIEDRQLLNLENNKITEGTICFCKEDSSIHVAMNQQLVQFGGNKIELIKFENEDFNNGILGQIDQVVIINNREQLNADELKSDRENKNIVYLIKDDHQIVVYMNNEIVFEMAGTAVNTNSNDPNNGD